MMFGDRRSHLRYEQKLPMQIWAGGDSNFWAESINLSSRGFFCKSPRFIRPHSKVSVSLYLPFVSGTPSTLLCDCIVTRTEPGAERAGVEEYSLAMNIFNIDQEKSVLIEDYLSESERAQYGSAVRPIPMARSNNRGQEPCIAGAFDNFWQGPSGLQQVSPLDNLEDLATTLAHDIKNPLAGIVSSLQVLGQDQNDNTFFQEVLGEIFCQANRLDQVINNLLQYACPGINKPSPVNLDKVLRDALFLLEEQNQEKIIQVDVCNGEDQPLFEGDDWLLQQAIHNLLQNAKEATEEHGTMALHTWWPGKVPKCNRKVCKYQTAPGGSDCLKIAIIDTGRGIAEKSLKKIFIPLITSKEEARGVGLSIAHRIIDQHRGKVFVGSEEGKGSVFLICLPIGQSRGGDEKEKGINC